MLMKMIQKRRTDDAQRGGRITRAISRVNERGWDPMHQPEELGLEKSQDSSSTVIKASKVCESNQQLHKVWRWSL